jgi:hypothetical protein
MSEVMAPGGPPPPGQQEVLEEQARQAAEQTAQAPAPTWGGAIDLGGVADMAQVGVEAGAEALDALSAGGEVLGGVLEGLGGALEGLGGCAEGCSVMIALALLLASGGAVLASAWW